MKGMDINYFVTITGTKHYYGMKPMEIGRILKLVKEKNNEYDDEAIAALLPYIGVVGYVANSPNTVARGTYSAGRIYDTFEEETYAQILFATKDSVICLLISPQEIEGDNASSENTLKDYTEGKQVESKVDFKKENIKMAFFGQDI